MNLENELEDYKKINEIQAQKINEYKLQITKAINHIMHYCNGSGSFIDGKFAIENIEEIYNGNELLKILEGE